MSLQEEKNIIRKMDDLKRMKPKIRAYKAGEEELAVRYQEVGVEVPPTSSFTAIFARAQQLFRVIASHNRFGSVCLLQGLKRQKSTVFDSIKSREATISELHQVSLPSFLRHL